MKICPKCGVTQADERTVCVDCGTMLEDVPEEKAEQIEREQLKKLSHIADRSDVLERGKINNVCIVIQSVIAAADIVLMFANRSREVAGLFLLSAFICAVGIINAAFPRLMWKLETLRLIFIVDTSDLMPSPAYDLFYHGGIIFLTVITALATIFAITFI